MELNGIPRTSYERASVTSLVNGGSVKCEDMYSYFRALKELPETRYKPTTRPHTSAMG